LGVEVSWLLIVFVTVGACRQTIVQFAEQQVTLNIFGVFQNEMLLGIALS
jgi:hypothetical protein